jgi:hypothetical protein
MNLEGAIALAGGVIGLGSALWKVFGGIADLRLKISRLEDANRANELLLKGSTELWIKVQSLDNGIEANELAINGVRERLEHTNKRTVEAAKKMYARINRMEDWLTKNTDYQPSADR